MQASPVLFPIFIAKLNHNVPFHRGNDDFLSFYILQFLRQIYLNIKVIGSYDRCIGNSKYKHLELTPVEIAFQSFFEVCSLIRRSKECFAVCGTKYLPISSNFAKYSKMVSRPAGRLWRQLKKLPFVRSLQPSRLLSNLLHVNVIFIISQFS